MHCQEQRPCQCMHVCVAHVDALCCNAMGKAASGVSVYSKLRMAIGQSVFGACKSQVVMGAACIVALPVR